MNVIDKTQVKELMLAYLKSGDEKKLSQEQIADNITAHLEGIFDLIDTLFNIAKSKKP